MDRIEEIIWWTKSGKLLPTDIGLLFGEIERLRGIEVRLIALIDKHITDSAQYTIAPAEVQNVLEPGSAPMYPREAGYAATCSLCMPEGDGVNFRRGKK